MSTAPAPLSPLSTRLATPEDAEALARIYNEGIEDRTATFETRLRTAEDVRGWFDGRHPVVVVEEAGRVVAFGSTSAYSARPCYAGVADFSIYVAREARGRGAGRAALERLLREAETAGFWKLVSRAFVENVASRRMLKRAGFREVGVHERHARLDGAWRDVVVVECLLGEARTP